MSAILRVEHIKKTYQAQNGEIEAISDISFTVEEGEYIGIVGPSGCGKSTLLSIIAGLYAPSGGQILVTIHGQRNDAEFRIYAAERNLLEWRTIWKNVLLGLECGKMLSSEAVDMLKSCFENPDSNELRISIRRSCREE
jgi:NitT/TauT family transport system ATP-binding protein